VKVNVATDTPENLPSPGESGCNYAENQENECNDDVLETAASSNERQMCSELQIDMTADDFSSWAKKRISHALNDTY
jgi:hypothetical protein